MPLDLFSDRLYFAAAAVYVLATMLHAAEHVFAREPVPAGARGPDHPERTRHTERTERSDRFGHMAVALTVLGTVALLASIALRGLAVGRWPLGNMYEFGAAICFCAVLTWLITLRRMPALRRIGVFVLPVPLILMFLGGTVLYVPAAPVMPALQSYWLSIHVTTVATASGLLIVAGSASAAFLLGRAATHEPGRLAAALPSPDVLDRLAYRVTVVAFPIYTFAVIAGGIWAEAAWGRFWGWDPKETVAFIAWVIYAAYLHARSTTGWRAERAAWLNVLGLAAMVFNLFFVNLVVAGLHSYAGLQ